MQIWLAAIVTICVSVGANAGITYAIVDAKSCSSSDDSPDSSSSSSSFSSSSKKTGVLGNSVTERSQYANYAMKTQALTSRQRRLKMSRGRMMVDLATLDEDTALCESTLEEALANGVMNGVTTMCDSAGACAVYTGTVTAYDSALTEVTFLAETSDETVVLTNCTTVSTESRRRLRELTTTDAAEPSRHRRLSTSLDDHWKPCTRGASFSTASAATRTAMSRLHRMRVSAGPTITRRVRSRCASTWPPRRRRDFRHRIARPARLHVAVTIGGRARVARAARTWRPTTLPHTQTRVCHRRRRRYVPEQRAHRDYGWRDGEAAAGSWNARARGGGRAGGWAGGRERAWG